MTFEYECQLRLGEPVERGIFMKNTPGESVPQSLHLSTEIASVQGDYKTPPAYVPFDQYSTIYLTIHYACGHQAIRPILRDKYEMDYPMHHKLDDRHISAQEYCQACKAGALRAYERKMERRGVA